jgi:hypothetical protein
VASARKVGGFHRQSRYTGDWDLWFRLGLNFGVARTDRVVAKVRDHRSPGRGTVRVEESGRRFAYVNMQRRKNLAALERLGVDCRASRAGLRGAHRVPARYLLEHGYAWHERLLAYNGGLVSRSVGGTWKYRLLRSYARVAGRHGMRCLSGFWRRYQDFRDRAFPMVDRCAER